MNQQVHRFKADFFKALAHPIRLALLNQLRAGELSVMGIHALERLIRAQRAQGGDVLLTSLQPAVRRMMERTDLIALDGDDHIFWNAVEATVRAHMQHAQGDCPHCQGLPPILIHDEPRLATAVAHHEAAK